MPTTHDWLTGWNEDVGSETLMLLQNAIPDTRGWAVNHVYEHDGHGTRHRTIGVSATMNSGRRIEATARWVCMIEDPSGAHKTEIWHDRGTVEGILIALGRRSMHH